MSFTSQTAELTSGPLSYRKGGSGRAILHLHGSGGPYVSPVLEHLAGRHTIYMPTVPGFDATPMHPSVATVPALADLMADFIRTTIGTGCDVIGVSFGGWVALWLAARHPDLVEQLVLEAPAGLRTEGTGGLPADADARFRALYAVPERAPKEARPEAMLAENRRVRERYTGDVAFDAALAQALGEIKARTLILFGTQDQVVPIESGRRVQAGIARSHLSFVYGAAHVLEFDQPHRVARLVGAFLERGEAFLVRTPAA